MHRSRPRSFTAAASLALACAALGAPALARADALGVYYERTVMTDAGRRCGLFTPELASALAAAQAQARGAALRSGASADLLGQLADRARGRVQAVSCASPDIATAAGRVRSAFDGYSRLQRMNFPGDTSDWTADRGVSRIAPLWKLSQSAPLVGGTLTFGIAGEGEDRELLAVASFPGGAEPYAARLVLRDPTLAPEPFLNGLHARGPLPLAARTPPRSATQAVLAEARDRAPSALLPAGTRSGYAFRFPRSAIAALAELDPREAVAIEFLFPSDGREAVRTAYIEVGDFAAGRAFLTTARR